MHREVDYNKRAAPAFDAVCDIVNWFGEKKYREVAAMMKHVKDPKAFSFYCSFGGVEGFPVKCWYEHFHGQGSWDKAWAEFEAQAERSTALETEK
jgi:hypothetical protein